MHLKHNFLLRFPLTSALKVSFFIAIVILAASCGSESYCKKHYSAQSFEIIHSDTVITHAKGETVIPSKQVSIDTALNIPVTLDFHESEKKNGLTARIDISKGRAKFTCSEDSLKMVIDSLKMVIRINDTKQVVSVANCNLPHKTKFNYFCSYFFWFFIVLVVIGLIVKFK